MTAVEFPSTRRRRSNRPVDLHEPVGFTSEGEPISRLDRVREVMFRRGYEADCAAACGAPLDTYRDWIKIGTRARADLLNGRSTWGKLSKHERQCVELVDVAEEAEADGRMALLTIAGRLAEGGLVSGRVVEKYETVVDEHGATTDPVLVERRVTSEETLPDSGMVKWLLERRWPAEFSRRVEVTGQGGGPIETSSPLDRLVAHLDRIADARARHELPATVTETRIADDD